MENVKRILVVSRLAQYAKEVVQVGISMAKRFGADLQVLHLFSNPVDQEALNAPLPFPDDRHKSYLSREQEAKEELDRILKRELEMGLKIKLTVKDGKPADEIQKLVQEENIDLVIMLAHSEGRLEHILFGRDDDDIIRRLPCSMLLVKKEPEAVKW